MTTKLDRFISKAKEVHGDRYDYTNTVYVKYNIKIVIVCPTHGEFKQTPTNHLNTGGCRLCGVENSAKHRTDSRDYYVLKANLVYNNKYDYSKIVYRGSSRNIIVTCPEHGVFTVTANAHLHGNGCIACGDRHNRKRDIPLRRSKPAIKLKTKEFIIRAKEVHGDRYDYTNTVYVIASEPVNILCNKHGVFTVYPSAHLMAKRGCPSCENRFRRSKGLRLINYAKVTKSGVFTVMYKYIVSVIKKFI